MKIETVDRETYRKCAFLVERAVKTIMALPDPDRRYRVLRSSGWPEMVRSAHDAYGATPVKRRFRPTARDVSNCLAVLDWLTWLKNQPGGRHEFDVIWRHALGASFFRLAEHFGKSERTIRRWHEGGMVRVTSNFLNAVSELES